MVVPADVCALQCSPLNLLERSNDVLGSALSSSSRDAGLGDGKWDLGVGVCKLEQHVSKSRLEVFIGHGRNPFGVVFETEAGPPVQAVKAGNTDHGINSGYRLRLSAHPRPKVVLQTQPIELAGPFGVALLSDLVEVGVKTSTEYRLRKQVVVDVAHPIGGGGLLAFPYEAGTPCGRATTMPRGGS